jgi:hypothetical protein
MLDPPVSLEAYDSQLPNAKGFAGMRDFFKIQGSIGLGFENAMPKFVFSFPPVDDDLIKHGAW